MYAKDEARKTKEELKYYMEQVADLKRELCGLESQSNLIVFSSKVSTVSPSEAAHDDDTST